jgi:peptidyl-prolyl cis-trans isomerase B (cyclophilin B)
MHNSKATFFITLLISLFAFSCNQANEETAKEQTEKMTAMEQTESNSNLQPPAKPYVMDENPHLIIETDKGKMEMELKLKESPMTASNFLYLVRQGFYDGLIWHRVIPGFVIQGGDPEGTGRGGPGYSIDFEENDLKHTPGAVAMARSRDPNSAGSQFYIALDNLAQLDGGYVVFGELVSGLDVAKSIAAVERNNRDKPLEDVHIVKIYEKKSK